jgi:CheY-like chemotaxis protein
MDGREVLKYLQSARPPALRSIFAVTSDLSPDRIEEVRSLGADALLPKPVNISRLIELCGSR